MCNFYGKVCAAALTTDPALFDRMTQMMGGVVTPEREARRKAAETHPDRMDLLKAEEHFKAAFPECRAENE